MDDVFYSTGQAAQELGITQARIRILCDSRAIDATCTAGGQWRIPKDEVERLKQEGLPSVPRPLPQPRYGAGTASGQTRATLLAEPSVKVIDSAEELVRLEHEVKAVALRRQKEEGLDWFRERDEREAAQKAELEKAEKHQRAEAEALRQRQLWEKKWLEHGLSLVPRDAPASYKLDVHRAVGEALQQLNPEHGELITRQLVTAAANRALVSWNQIRQAAEVLERVCTDFRLPWDVRHDTDWRARMLKAGAEGLKHLRDGATRVEMEAAARSAIQPLVQAFEHGRLCADILRSVQWELSRANSQELEEGMAAMRKALEGLPIGTLRRDMERTRSEALAPVRAKIAARLDQEMRAGVLRSVDMDWARWPQPLQKQAMEEIHGALGKLPQGTPRLEIEKARDEVLKRFQTLHERREHKRQLIDSGLCHIRPYLDQLSIDWEFDQNTYTLARELEEPIRTALAKEIDDRATGEDVVQRVRRLVRRHLDIR